MFDKLLTTSTLFEWVYYHGEALVVAVVVASLQRVLHGTTNVEISITFSDPHGKCLREIWQFIFLHIFFPEPSLKKLAIHVTRGRFSLRSFQP